MCSGPDHASTNACTDATSSRCSSATCTARPVLASMSSATRWPLPVSRTPTGDLYVRAGGIDPEVLARVAAAQTSGVLVDTMSAADLFSLTIAMASAWPSRP